MLKRLEDIVESLEKPLYRSLEVGFRHNPLSPKEKLERYKETCEIAAIDLKYIIDEIRKSKT